MNNYTSYKILNDLDLVIEYYEGQIMIDDIINLKRRLFIENNYHSEIKILMDFRGAITKIDKSDLLKYLEFAKENITFIGDRKVALLTSQPNQVVLGLLFKQIKDKPMKIEVFSTIKAAVYWLQVNNYSLMLIENAIKNIVQNTYAINYKYDNNCKNKTHPKFHLYRDAETKVFQS